jgi:hypothetical protein
MEFEYNFSSIWKERDSDRTWQITEKRIDTKNERIIIIFRRDTEELRLATTEIPHFLDKRIF